MKSLLTDGVSMTLIRLFVLLATACCIGGCAGARIGSMIGEHELVERCLPVRSTLGADLYRDLLQYGPTIKDYVQTNGDPAYFLIEQPGALFVFTFLYPERDSAVYFRDPGSVRASFGEIITDSPMPRALLGRMSDADQAIALQVNPGEVERPLDGRWRDAYRSSGSRSRTSSTNRRRHR